MKKMLCFLLLLTLFISCGSDDPIESIIPEDPKRSTIDGKTFWTIFDSLGENSWQDSFSEQTGSLFNKELNTLARKPITQGGTPTSPNTANGTLGRAKNLVSYKGQYPIDVVFIENVNDIHYVDNNANISGGINDIPWMMGDKIVGYAGGFTSYQAAKDYASANLLSILNSISTDKRKEGAILTIPYTNNNQNGYRVKILSKATISGNASVVRDGKKYSFAVTPQTEIQDIINFIIQYSYGSGWNVVDNGDNSATIFYYTTTSSVITFDDGGTGIQSEVTKEGSAGEYCKYFVGHTASEWIDASRWVEDISLWSRYKGLIEYLKTNLPNATLYWFIPTYYNIDFNDNSIKNEDGSFSKEKYEATAIYKRWRALKDCQLKVCEYYNLSVKDIDTLSEIDLTNITMYYNSDNVHPKKEGYERWAEVLSKEFQVK